MIEARRLLVDLQRQVRGLEADLLSRAESDRDVHDRLLERFHAAKDGQRTGVTYETWRGQQLTQVAVGWVLGCVFTRFCEDNALLEHPMLAGPVNADREVDGVAEARERQALYFRQPGHSAYSDLDYLRAAIGRLERYDATRVLVNRQNPLHLVDISPDTATEVLAFWRRVDPASGTLAHDFTDEASSTRFLGDLYQDLSEQARKDYALLQTPDFVEKFILDHTLDPAIDEYGLAEVRMIDPACGSGHFLLGAFRRLLGRWQKQASGLDVKVHVERVLAQVHGVDINPFAVAIARFRLVIAALTACRITRLADAPTWRIRIAIGDSLLWGVGGRQDETDGIAVHALAGSTGVGEFTYEYEDARELIEILGQRYHAVVGNPPYVTVKDPAPNRKYRDWWDACSGQYAMSVPFAQRFFGLAVRGGFTGQITANSFMKREFGRELIENFFPAVDLTHIIDTSDAHIPGCGTPTVIIFGRNRRPVLATVRMVLGIRGEPTVPSNPADGLVWTSIAENVEIAGAETKYVAVTDADRNGLAYYPWSLVGGGASELMECISSAGTRSLGAYVHTMGRTAHTGDDESYLAPSKVWVRLGVTRHSVVPIVEGESVRDWGIGCKVEAIFPYEPSSLKASLGDPQVSKLLWLTKRHLKRRREPGGTHEEVGLAWFEFSRFHPERFSVPLGIAWSEVATHNNFVLDRGGKVFKQTAPAIKLSLGSSERDHLQLLGFLNSSVGRFSPYIGVLSTRPGRHDST